MKKALNNKQLKPALRLKEAAEFLGVNVFTLRRAIERGELAASRVGRCIVVRPEDLDRFLLDNRI